MVAPARRSLTGPLVVGGVRFPSDTDPCMVLRMETLLAGSALALAVASLACTWVLPARSASATIKRGAARLHREILREYETHELELSKLKAQVLDVLDQVERKRASTAASASKLKQQREPDMNHEPLSQEEVLAGIRERVLASSEMRESIGWKLE